MKNIGIVGLIIMIINVFFSYKGFTDRRFFNKYKFDVDGVLIYKDYKKLITSGFLHVGWIHLIFNMMSLYAFSTLLEFQIGALQFTLIYFASLVCGDLLALFVHRNHGDYSSLGASRAVCGVIFASIALFPGLEIGFFGIPFGIPSWLYGMLYVGYSIYGIKSSKDNIGHEAHLGGALVGMLIAIILHPNAMVENYLPILIVTLPSIAFIYLIITKPHFLLINIFSSAAQKTYQHIDHKYTEQKIDKQKEIDKLLDKISTKEMDSLSPKEKQKLEEYSK